MNERKEGLESRVRGWLPKELHEFLRCLCNHQLEIKASRDGKTTHIILIDKQEQDTSCKLSLA